MSFAEDKDDEWTEAIDSTHPLKVKTFAQDDMAREIVGNRHSKGVLVDLVRYLLVQIDNEKKQHETSAKLFRKTLEKVRKDRDSAYEERNRVVAALASAFPSGIAQTAIEGWNPDWNGCVYVDLPVGQASWHYHISQSHLFSHLRPYNKAWDGHTTAEKYERLDGMKHVKFKHLHQSLLDKCFPTP